MLIIINILVLHFKFASCQYSLVYCVLLYIHTIINILCPPFWDSDVGGSDIVFSTIQVFKILGTSIRNCLLGIGVVTLKYPQYLFEKQCHQLLVQTCMNHFDNWVFLKLLGWLTWLWIWKCHSLKFQKLSPLIHLVGLWEIVPFSLLCHANVSLCMLCNAHTYTVLSVIFPSV